MTVKTFTVPPLENTSIRQFFKNVKQPSVFIDKLVAMSKGNPGGATILSMLVEDFEEVDAMESINILDRNGIYGGNIWGGYKDFCGSDINKFREELRTGTVIKQVKESKWFIDY